jgi:hypothetical protein
MVSRAALVPARNFIGLNPDQENGMTYEIKIELVFKQVQKLDNMFMVNGRQEHNLRWKSSKDLVFHPSVFWDLLLDDELHSDFSP